MTATYCHGSWPSTAAISGGYRIAPDGSKGLTASLENLLLGDCCRRLQASVAVRTPRQRRRPGRPSHMACLARRMFPALFPRPASVDVVRPTVSDQMPQPLRKAYV